MHAKSMCAREFLGCRAQQVEPVLVGPSPKSEPAALHLDTEQSGATRGGIVVCMQVREHIGDGKDESVQDAFGSSSVYRATLQGNPIKLCLLSLAEAGVSVVCCQVERPRPGFRSRTLS